ncbi:MAG: hypothetical protein OEW04_05980 [Nitrospirota bacterium]|nr:hypothetical protein [Nitrospirota bacterium]
MEIQDSRFKVQKLNEKGIALVLVLILAMISLAIVSALLFMATQGTVISGAQKFYRTAEEAATGAAELSVEYLANRGEFTLLGASHPILGTLNDGCNCGDPMITTDNIDLNVIPNARTCRCDKLCNATADWLATCDENTGVSGMQIDLNPKMNPEFSFELGNFKVYTKIVDTVSGNTDLGGVAASGELGGSAVSSSAAGIVTPPHSPYLYRMEVQAEDKANPRELSRISVLYAY